MDLIIAGKGPSAADFDWPDIPIMGVSGGYEYVPYMDHWVSLDKPMHFPQWLTDSERFNKHVPNNKFAPYWRKYPRVCEWEYEVGNLPTFSVLQLGTPEPGPFVTGPLPRNYSLLFAVQVAPRLGFDRLIFIGCDLLDNELHPIADVLKLWHPLARKAGIEWLNASRMSILGEWMPQWMPQNQGVCIGS